MANSLPGSPIVGFFNEATEDFEEHNQIIEISGGEWKVKDTTRPYGFVDLNARVWFQKYLDDGVEHEYLCTEGYLWTGQYPEAKRVIEKGNNQSMELDDNFIDGEWAGNDNSNYEFFIINEAVISKLCILGEEFEPCFEGSTVESFDKIKFSLDDGFKNKMFALIKEMQEILTQGGDSMTNDETKLVEEEVIEETVVEEENLEETVESVEEETAGESAVEIVEYALDEIPEYVQMTLDYAAAQQKIDELTSTIEQLNDEVAALKETNAELTTFKLAVEKEQKTAMIESFYMLSDEDKKDVIENIDTYSLNDIEAKLSVICVRNKVSFALDNNESSAEVSVNIHEAGEDSGEFIPAWIKRAKAIDEEMQKN